jgi:hypothetical protein
VVMEPAMSAALVQGLTPAGLSPKQVSLVKQFILRDCGDHVEWTDGRTLKHWRLPDQHAADPALPVLTTVSRLHSGSAVAPVAQLKTIRPIYCGPDGEFLAYACAPRLWIKALSDRCYPPEVFHLLVSRGVRVVDESFTTVEQVEQVHPGMSTNVVASFYRRHAFLVILATFLVVILIVEVATFVRG